MNILMYVSHVAVSGYGTLSFLISIEFMVSKMVAATSEIKLSSIHFFMDKVWFNIRENLSIQPSLICI